VVTAMSVDMGAYEQTVSKVRGGVGTIEGRSRRSSTVPHRWPTSRRS